MADPVTAGTGFVVSLLSSEAIPILLILFVFGVIAAYVVMLWLARNGM